MFVELIWKNKDVRNLLVKVNDTCFQAESCVKTGSLLTPILISSYQAKFLPVNPNLYKFYKLLLKASPGLSMADLIEDECVVASHYVKTLNYRKLYLPVMKKYISLEKNF